MRILLVDDEPLARERLRALLQHEPGATIIGECGSGPEAIAAIRRDAPDLVFLDMQMPGCDGLQVVADLPLEGRPAVVFVTAHEKFALEAFDVQAVDYLLKPYDRERFQQALRRAQGYLQARRAGELGQHLETLLAQAAGASSRAAERLTVKVDGRVVFVRPEEIVWVEAADNYVILHLREDRLMLRETLSALEERLGPKNFARVNRSAIVHLDQVRELQPTFHGDYVVILRNGTKLPLSRSLRGQLGSLMRGSL
ncbi:MAG TPA: LytTR family DNA-binding domain-containing protein [Candidatus Synoicihabitans sp.]|nr:LytTR family DNA-binding domain-containing protein [Candidatus Synoicihabitans sp.]